MLPINIDINKFKQSTKMQIEQEKENKKKKNSCSQQALANQLVIGTTPTNPNSGQIQQTPAKQ